MTQTKTQSLIEAITNTVVDFGISLATTFVIFPLLGIATTPSKNLLITLFFTAISIVCGYVIRRWFNQDSIKANKLRYPDGKLYWLHCFACENAMPVVEDKDAIYCSNCGLKH
ncbi:DUF7220 family protein [Pseudotamlana carrageenivorans]|uniref:DUF7220 family protein n=1 Tax=Pseudotamlana carrageenivorans TaxID=2069432 RepID=UPI0018F0318D|nr:hypothetical protein [Tamlana carrageenivorans]